MKPFETSHWSALVLGVVAIKVLFFGFDSIPQFFFGDSGTYLASAVHGWVPADRSYLYGRFIRWTALPARSLTTLVIAQVVLSAGSAVVLSTLLHRFLSVRPWIAVLVGLVCALEPIQLLYERYVMAETASLFAFVVWIAGSFWVLEAPRVGRILLWHATGLLVIGLRLSFLPAMLIAAVLVPLLACMRLRDTVPLGRAAVHSVGISLVSMFVLHSGYKHIHGRLSGQPPAYLNSSGLFLASGWMPVIAPEDCENPGLRESLFSSITVDTSNRFLRDAHRWGSGGFVDRILSLSANPREADEESKAIALNALRRDPIGVIQLGLSTYFDYWNQEHMRKLNVVDRGDLPASAEFRALTEEYARAPAESFQLGAPTVTNRLVFRSQAWFALILLTPLCAAFPAFFASGSQRWSYVWVWILITCLIAVMCVFSTRPSFRYLHASAWLSWLVSGMILEWAAGLLRSRCSRENRSRCSRAPI